MAKTLKFILFSSVILIFASILIELLAPIRINRSKIVPYQEAIHTDRQYEPEIRVIMSKGMCSGVVIDDNYALSAAHCVEKTFGFIDKNRLLIFDKNDNPTAATGEFIAYDADRDIALIRGDFKNFNNRRPAFNPRTAPVSNVTACGFPANSDYYCVGAIIVGNKRFQYMARSYPIFKGMSGGPVYDENMRVIGVNSAAGDNVIILSPVIGVDKVWGI